jgi:hypothetical protein
MNRIARNTENEPYFASAILVVIAAVFAASFAPAPARADVITAWNAEADVIALANKVPAPVHARGQAILHVAMFEAVNAVERRYSPYHLTLTADRSTSKEAAAAAAAYTVLATLYPNEKTKLDGLLEASLNGANRIPAGESREKGIALGRQAATGILALRANDDAKADEGYRPATSPGVYVPTIIPLFSTFGRLQPWSMTSGSQFRPAPPPALNSQTWTRDLNEIREMGALNSSKRTAEQADIGRFWFFTGPYTYDPIARQVAETKKLDLVDCARMFALVAIAGGDAGIAVFDAKYTYNLWRPVTAIRNADQTGNTATPREASWLPLGDTPMHPEYPCAHCITSSAVSAVMQSVVGNEVPEITMTSPTAPGVVRKWTRLQDYSDEVSLARIYAGFHYRFSTEVGKDMGRKIAAQIVATQLRGVEASALPSR